MRRCPDCGFRTEDKICPLCGVRTKEFTVPLHTHEAEGEQCMLSRQQPTAYQNVPQQQMPRYQQPAPRKKARMDQKKLVRIILTAVVLFMFLQACSFILF